MRNSSRFSILSFLLLTCLTLGCGNPSADCEIFVNDTLLLDGVITFTPKNLAHNNVLGRVENGKVMLVDNITLQPGTCEVVLRTTKKAVQGDESFTPTYKASAAETIVLTKEAFDIPDGGFELKFQSGVK